MNPLTRWSLQALFRWVLVATAIVVCAPASAATNTWGPAAPLASGRSDHTSTLLPSGQVLVAGGSASGTYLASTELYDPASNTWSPAGSLATARYKHTATLLPSGQVLVAGGYDNSHHSLASAELYDPASKTWTLVGSLANARYLHTATLLPSGQVLVSGGFGNSGLLASAELYNPVNKTWTMAGSLATARSGHTATLLPSGQVLVAAGIGSAANYLATAELYEPVSKTWSFAGSLGAGRSQHTATLLPSGQVLVAAGVTNFGNILATAERYDPVSNTWSAAGSLATARWAHSATLLPSGQVLVSGGADYVSTPLASAVRYDPASNTWSPAASLAAARSKHTATLLPTGQILVMGGYGSDFGDLASAERYDPASTASSPAASLTTPRFYHTATMLRSGQVLVVGGAGNNSPLASTERYNAASNAWTAAGSLATGRVGHTATLLPSGQVLVAGGASITGDPGVVELSAEQYDPVSNTWAHTGSLATARFLHTATLLPSGQVLVVGGGSSTHDGDPVWSSAELYDPASKTWSSTGSLATARSSHTATLLSTGQVLVVGGKDVNGDYLASAELYDPASKTWSSTSALALGRGEHTATLLPSGQVLVAGGVTNNGNPAIAERYDPNIGNWITGGWTSAGSLATARVLHTATLLPSGQVLVAGGFAGNSGVLASAELYDPASNTWTGAGSLATARAYSTVTLLPSGKLLVAGGAGVSNDLTSAELFDSGLAPDATRQPNLSAVNPYLLQTSKLTATAQGSINVFGTTAATGFWPLLEGGGGATNNSASNTPVFQVQRIDNDQMRFIPNDKTVSFTDTAFTGSASAFAGFPAGPVRVRAWVNGVPSVEGYSTLAVKPGAVTTPTAVAGYAQATVTFAPVAYAGGAPVITYGATAVPGGAQGTCAAPCTSIVVSPLATGTYRFIVTAINAAGIGPPSAQSNSVVVNATDKIFQNGFEVAP